MRNKRGEVYGLEEVSLYLASLRGLIGKEEHVITKVATARGGIHVTVGTGGKACRVGYQRRATVIGRSVRVQRFIRWALSHRHFDATATLGLAPLEGRKRVSVAG